MPRSSFIHLLWLLALCASCSGADGPSGGSGGPANGTNAGGGASGMTGVANFTAGASNSGTAGGGSLLTGTAGGTGSDTGAGLPCGAPAATRTCCYDEGTQTCTGIEFRVWGPCVSPSGILDKCSGTEKLPPDAGPPPPPPPPALCTDPAANTEPEILAGYSPYPGQTVGLNGQIKVWVNDENPPFIAPGELADATTGTITMPGNRTARAPDGFLWEPALYIGPQTASNGGTPHFPTMIKGAYNNAPPTRGTGIQGAPLDPIPPGTPPPPAATRTNRGGTAYHGEFIWEVSSLGLAPGTYSAEFLIFDGDRDRGIGCVNLVITP
jgi:hypothetical protein